MRRQTRGQSSSTRRHESLLLKSASQSQTRIFQSESRLKRESSSVNLYGKEFPEPSVHKHNLYSKLSHSLNTSTPNAQAGKTPTARNRAGASSETDPSPAERVTTRSTLAKPNHLQLSQSMSGPADATPSTTRHQHGFRLFTDEYRDFIGAGRRPRPQPGPRLSSLSTGEIRRMCEQQALLDIPVIKVKSYFGCVSTAVMSRAMHDDSIVRVSGDFVRDEFDQKRHTLFESSDLRAEIARTHSLKSHSQYALNHRVMLELQKNISVEGLRDFGIDVSYLEGFFDKTVKPRNLRTKSGAPERRLNSPENAAGLETHKQETPKLQGQKPRAFRLKNSVLQHMRGANLFKRQSDPHAFLDPLTRRNFSVIQTLPETCTDAFWLGHSFLVKPPQVHGERPEPSTHPVGPPDQALYSFRDDVTLDDATHVYKDDYVRGRLHSKSFLDLSKIDWSASVASKHPSVFQRVSTFAQF